MPVSGLIVRTRPSQARAVAHACATVPSVEVTHVDAAALVVVTQGNTEAADRQAMESLQKLAGVVAVELIYHNFEDVQAHGH